MQFSFNYNILATHLYFYSGYFELTDDGKNLIIFPDNGGEYMVYFASLDEQLRTGGIRTKLQITPIVNQLKHVYYVSE